MRTARNLRRHALLLCLFAGLVAGCAGKDNFQNKMKGLWVLKSRTLPGGETVVPPSVSGRLEWFPMDINARTAHVSVLTTHGDEGVQIHGSHYNLNDYQTFSQESYLRVGGGIRKTHDKTYTSERTQSSGSIQVEGSRITFRHDGGPTYVFEGSNLTIEHADGTKDVLAK
tara:strand:- start:701 stop:1210 length:510 start_codon:yes stop_codon:yes gene_type:complete